MSNYASIIHAKAMELAKGGLGPLFRTYRSTPMLQIQPGDLPVLAIHILRERRLQDGQANQTVPHFKHSLTIGFSGAVHVQTDKQDQLQDLEETMSLLDDILLCDPRFVNLVEGVTEMDRVSQYAKVGETTLFEIRVEMVMEFSSRFEPTIDDDLKTVHVTTQYPDKAHVDSGTPQIEAEYTIETDSGP
jgi:hypothetical protein